MKITFKIDTNIEDDLDELNLIINARDYYIALENIRAKIRSHLKYGELDAEMENILTNLNELIPEEK